ncbi:hypothetical protein BHE74_00002055 [Ensete ventricosum]|nr:hypothetical protein BHE74_00002055 [Ensete ventricosum]
MGCVSSKNAVSVTPAIDSSGFLRDHRELSGPILACSLRHQTGQGPEQEYPERKVEEDSLEPKEYGKPNGQQYQYPERKVEEDSLESKDYGKPNSDSTRLQSFRLGNLHKHIEGEQVAAGWPSWLCVVAGEAIHGWVPLKADSFEKLEKVNA